MEKMDISEKLEVLRQITEELNSNPTPQWDKYKRKHAERMKEQAASTVLRLTDNEQYYKHFFPGFCKEFQMIHNAKPELAKHGHDWPATVWVPGNAPTTTDWDTHRMILHHMATWQQTRGVYQFEPELWEALKDSDWGDAPLPTDAFARLPHYCVYLDFQNRAGDHLGAYVMQDYHVGTGEKALSILHEIYHHDDIKQMGVKLVLRAGIGLQQAIDISRQEVFRVLLSEKRALSQEMYSAALRDPIGNNPESVALVVKLALYLCSSNPDAEALRNKAKQPPSMQSMKKGPRQMPDPKIRIFKVGQEIARELREVKALAKQSEEEETARTGRKPINPHIRRAHFHPYFLGPRAGEQTRDVRWLPPTNVSPRVPAP